MKTSLSKLVIVSVLVMASASSYADDTVTAPVSQPTAAPSADTSWNGLLQKKYELTDAQMQTLNDSKLPDSQKAQVAQLAKSSGKSVEEVLKMRTEDKMGWGKIAKTLGVPPGELGKAVSELKRERNAERKKARDSKHEGRAHGGDRGHGKPDHAGNGRGKNK